MNRENILRGVGIAILVIILNLIFLHIYFNPGILTEQLSSNNENIAEIECYESEPRGQVVNITDLDLDKQQKVRHSIEEDTFSRINYSQKEYFENHSYFRYRDEIYYCPVGEW